MQACTKFILNTGTTHLLQAWLDQIKTRTHHQGPKNKNKKTLHKLTASTKSPSCCQTSKTPAYFDLLLLASCIYFSKSYCLLLTFNRTSAAYRGTQTLIASTFLFCPVQVLSSVQYYLLQLIVTACCVASSTFNLLLCCQPWILIPNPNPI